MKRLSKSIIIVSVILFLSVTSAFAATQTKTSTAEVNVQSGDLIFDQVPANFNFGDVPYPSSDTTTSLSSGTYALVVKDNRGSVLGLGYRVSVTALKLTGENNPATSVMKGNNIRMKGPIVLPDGVPIVGIPPEVNQDFFVDGVDTNGDPLATTVSFAPAGESSGLLGWRITWFPANITLVMSANEAPVDSYKSTITWTLYDAP